ncbi:hypothetical protein AAFF_G00095300 [Aldrovandia affinis]|uniref:Uncharacterized protein n=1 Tax=Aldrovandia affinis TaxID=143900 RepID=A0AAD7RW45_9TELE|nr:hypothetical protein AAFF_G00095300 [Aldrovandia affinis]
MHAAHGLRTHPLDLPLNFQQTKQSSVNMEGTQNRTPVPTYLAWSICNTLCCCLPIGIAAIIFSTKVSGANNVGDTTRAQEASRTAKILNIVGLVVGILLITLIVVLRLVLAKEGQ